MLVEKYLCAIVILLSLISLQLCEKTESIFVTVLGSLISSAFLIAGFISFFTL